jgi:hypothetical protein
MAATEGRPTGKRFTLEHLADDLVYQSLARPLVMAYLREQGCDSFDFSSAPEPVKQRCVVIVEEAWRAWCESAPGRAVLAACGIDAALAPTVHFSFPWQRAFECEAAASL